MLDGCLNAFFTLTFLTDVGLARDIYKSDYYPLFGGKKQPVRWMAPEALLEERFTIESDIWSYGVLLWEIMTLGRQPYEGLSNDEVVGYIMEKSCLNRPDECPPGL